MKASLLPVDIVLAPEWWNKNEGITFDPDFFFHPLRRVEVEQKMENVLFERWGRYGLGADKDEARPEIGAVHLAAGFLLSEMLGCQVHYTENHPPQVLAAHRDSLELNPITAFESDAFRRVLQLMDTLKKKYGRVTGDINWGGILNLAMDLRGEAIFMDMMLNPDEVNAYFRNIAQVIARFTDFLTAETGTTSISVNRDVRHLSKPVFLHSECSHTMISAEDYETFLLPFDVEWSKHHPFGIHYCGADPHRMAASFAKIPHLDYLDVGWGGDVAELRRHLPNTFFSLRLSPVELAKQTPSEIHDTIVRLVTASGDPLLTGVCCINMDDSVSDAQVATIFETVDELKRSYSSITN
jgi:hypothetical protein